jgi:hypothetical protein
MKEATSSPSERLTSFGGTGVMMAGGHPWIFGAITSRTYRDPVALVLDSLALYCKSSALA